MAWNGLSFVYHWVKNARIESFSGAYFFRIRENKDQKTSEYGDFSRSVQFPFTLVDPGIYEGDMELSPEQLEEVRNGKFSFGSMSNRERLWPNINGEVVIPYYIEKSLSKNILCFLFSCRPVSIQLLQYNKVQIAEGKKERIGLTHVYTFYLDASFSRTKIWYWRYNKKINFKCRIDW